LIPAPADRATARPIGRAPGTGVARRAGVLVALAIAWLTTASQILAAPQAPAATPWRFSGSEVVQAQSLGVDDGDSFVARLSDGRRARIRLAGIDAPEKSQPWSNAARLRLAELLDKRTLNLTILKADRWERAVARVEADGIDVSLAMLESGLAWHFSRYDSDLPRGLASRYSQAEREARRARAGLWREHDPEPPWAFRQRTRTR
jgi:endonuclease YncB( thermonuclease family)